MIILEWERKMTSQRKDDMSVQPTAHLFLAEWLIYVPGNTSVGSEKNTFVTLKEMVSLKELMLEEAGSH